MESGKAVIIGLILGACVGAISILAGRSASPLSYIPFWDSGTIRLQATVYNVGALVVIGMFAYLCRRTGVDPLAALREIARCVWAWLKSVLNARTVLLLIGFFFAFVVTKSLRPTMSDLGTETRRVLVVAVALFSLYCIARTWGGSGGHGGQSGSVNYPQL